MKGIVGIYETMIMGKLTCCSACQGLTFGSAAHAHSPQTASHLVQLLTSSHNIASTAALERNSHDITNVPFYVPNSFGKAFRFVAEMHEMAGFVHENLDATASTDEQEPGVSQLYDGFASLFQRVADSVEGKEHEHAQNDRDMDVLRAFADEAKRLRESET